MSEKEFKADHFKNIEELIENCKMWINDDDYDAYCRFFDMGAMEELIKELGKEKEKNKELTDLVDAVQEFKRLDRPAIELVHEMQKFEDDFISKDKIREKIKDREHIIHNAKLKYGQDYKMYEDTINARNEIELYKELLEE